MEGDFTIYYNNANEERFPIWAGQGTLESKVGDKTNAFDFIPPSKSLNRNQNGIVFFLSQVQIISNETSHY